MSAVLPLPASVATKTVAGSARYPGASGTFSLGKYREIIIAVGFFLLFDLGVLVLNFYTSFQIAQDAVGEIANTLVGNARKTLGAGLQISVPVKLRGTSGIQARVRQRPYAITLRWNHQNALVVVDMERRG